MSAPILQAWCREMSMPDDRGRCVWCDTQTGAAALLRPVETSDDPIRWHLRQGEPGWGPECPGCGGMKRKQSRQCATCRRANGYRGPDRSLRSHQARHITEELLYEARRLYGTGLSLNQVAAAIVDRTTYASEASCSNGLHSRRRATTATAAEAATATRAPTGASCASRAAATTGPTGPRAPASARTTPAGASRAAGQPSRGPTTA